MLPVVKFGLNNYHLYFHEESLELYLTMMEDHPAMNETSISLMPDLLEFLFGDDYSKTASGACGAGFEYVNETLPIIMIAAIRAPKALAANYLKEMLLLVDKGIAVAKQREDSLVLSSMLRFLGVLVESMVGLLGEHFESMFKFVCREIKTSKDGAGEIAAIRTVSD